MPVLTHDVHPSTSVGEGFRYGCWNMPRPNEISGYFAPNGLATTRHAFIAQVQRTFVPYRMSTECRYDKSLTDNGCAGCEHRGQGEDYDRMVRENGKA